LESLQLRTPGEACKEPQAKEAPLPLARCLDRTTVYERTRTLQMLMLTTQQVEVDPGRIVASTRPVVEAIKATIEESTNRTLASIGTHSLRWQTTLHKQAFEWSTGLRIRLTSSNLKQQEPTRSISSSSIKRL